MSVWLAQPACLTDRSFELSMIQNVVHTGALGVLPVKRRIKEGPRYIGGQRTSALTSFCLAVIV